MSKLKKQNRFTLIRLIIFCFEDMLMDLQNTNDNFINLQGLENKLF